MADILQESEQQDSLSRMLRNRLNIARVDPQLFQELEARNPLISRLPNAAAASQGISTPQQVQQVVQNQQQTQSQPQQQPAQGSQLGALAAKLLEDINAESSKKSKAIGPDLFGNGGLIGTGVSPSSALMYALGGLITSRLPQKEALALTMQIGGLPGEFEKSKQELAQAKLQTLLGTLNAQTAQGNLQSRNLELKQKQDKEQFITETFSDFEQRVKTGVPLTEQEKAIYATRLNRAGIDASVAAKIYTGRSLAEHLANLELAKSYAERNGLGGVSSSFEVEGQKLTFSGKEPTEKAYNVNAVKAYADTGIKGPGVPEGMTQPQAKQAVEAEQKRQTTLAGTKAGAVSANTPLPPASQTTILSFEDFINTVKRTRTALKDKYVGPARGRTYEYAREGLPGFTKPENEEVTFRSDLQNAADILVRARSGAQTAEPEFTRLQGIIGRATDNPKVLAASLDHIIKQGEAMLKERKRLAVTPKKDIATPPGAGKKVE